MISDVFVHFLIPLNHSMVWQAFFGVDVIQNETSENNEAKPLKLIHMPASSS